MIVLRYYSRLVCLCLQKLILSETSIYDVLHDFFYHTNNLVKMAALEVSKEFSVSELYFSASYLLTLSRNTGYLKKPCFEILAYVMLYLCLGVRAARLHRLRAGEPAAHRGRRESLYRRVPLPPAHNAPQPPAEPAPSDEHWEGGQSGRDVDIVAEWRHSQLQSQGNHGSIHVIPRL